MTLQRFRVPAASANLRLDSVVADLGGISRSHAKLLIERRHALLDGAPRKPAHTVRGGEVIELRPLPAQPTAATPEAIPLDVLYEDDHLAAINKPPGMVVHPAPGQWRGTLVNALLSYWGWDAQPDSLRPGIVHRLDKDTSGVILVAKRREVQAVLGSQFKRRKVGKTYHAAVVGRPPQTEGVITLPIGRHPHDRKKMSVHARKSRPAESRYKLLRFRHGASLVELHPRTGRTHQLRVHLAAVQHPILGDAMYGSRRRDQEFPPALRQFPRQALHARSIRFIHPVTGSEMMISAPYPDDFTKLLNAFCRMETESFR